MEVVAVVAAALVLAAVVVVVLGGGMIRLRLMQVDALNVIPDIRALDY